MKKNKLILTLLTTFLLCGCHFESYSPDVIYLNESCQIYEDDRATELIHLENMGFKFTESDDKSTVLISSKIKLNPNKNIALKYDDFLLGVGYENYEDVNKRCRSDKNKNIEANGFDIFASDLTSSVEYFLYFTMPYKKNNTIYSDVGVTLLIFHSYVFCNLERPEEVK